MVSPKCRCEPYKLPSFCVLFLLNHEIFTPRKLSSIWYIHWLSEGLLKLNTFRVVKKSPKSSTKASSGTSEAEVSSAMPTSGGSVPHPVESGVEEVTMTFNGVESSSSGSEVTEKEGGELQQE